MPSQWKLILEGHQFSSVLGPHIARFLTYLCFGAFKTAGTGGAKVGPGSGDLYGMAIPTRPAGAGPPSKTRSTPELQASGGSLRFANLKLPLLQPHFLFSGVLVSLCLKNNY